MDDGDRGYRKVLVGLLLVGALLSTLVGWVLYDSHVALWSHATETSVNLVTALKRDIRRTIETYDLSLKAAMRARLAPEFAELTPQTRHQLLFDGAIEARHLGSVLVLDAAGNILDDSSDVKRRSANYAERDFFRVHRDTPDAGLYISNPYFNDLTDEWSIAISRRLIGQDGEFDGVVAGSIGFSYFADLFAQLDFGPHGGVSLFNLNGTSLYRAPYLASQIGQDFSKASLFRELAAGRTAPYRDTARLDGLEKLFSFSVVDGLPLVLSVSTAVTDIYADWNNKALLICFTAAVLLVVGALLVQTARYQQIRRVRAERQTARSSHLFRAYFENSPDALFVVNVAPDGGFAYESLNPACETLTGLTDGRAIGKSPLELFDKDVGRSVEQRYRTCIDSGKTYIYQETRALSVGRRDWHAVLCPIKDQNGAVTLLLGSARDMTEQNRRDAEQHQASKMEAVGRLTAGIAHDFNNYLQTITSSLEILGDEYVTDPEGTELGEMARKAAASGARLTHRLLAFSRQQVLQPRRISVASLLSETRQLVGSAGFGPDIRFKIAVEPFTEDILVDPVQAESCLLNLMFNARDAMPTGGSLVLHARSAQPSDGVCGTLAPENVVIIAVHDTGTGMDSDTRERAFEPFFTTKVFGKGSGLGLSMVQGFCRQSGGDVRILSGGAVGTRIELWLPAAPAMAMAGTEVSSNIASLGRTTGRILLVEDEHDVSTALAAALVSGGFEVVVVNSGRDGLLRLHDRDPYDAILTDYAMPDMTGSEFLSRAAETAPGLPMLMLSGADIDAAILGLRHQSVTMLRKPVSRADLLLAVRDAIGATRTRLAA